MRGLNVVDTTTNIVDIGGGGGGKEMDGHASNGKHDDMGCNI